MGRQVDLPAESELRTTAIYLVGCVNGKPDLHPIGSGSLCHTNAHADGADVILNTSPDFGELGGERFQQLD